jgi:hypothetical protein
MSIIRDIIATSSPRIGIHEAGDGLAAAPAAIISWAVVGGDNALSDRVTPRNFRKTRKPLLLPKPGALGL